MKGKRVTLSVEQWAQIDAMREEGKPVKEIAKAIGSSEWIVGEALRNAGKGKRLGKNGTTEKPAAKKKEGVALNGAVGKAIEYYENRKIELVSELHRVDTVLGLLRADVAEREERTAKLPASLR